MRVFFALLLILLVPVQTWAAGAMQVRMESGVLRAGAHAADTQAGHALPVAMPGMAKPDVAMSDAAMPADCPMLHHDDANRSAPDSGTCHSCQLCMPLITLAVFALTAAAVPTWPPRSTLVQSFRTACLPPALEPPISA